jgi:hypothetical protein
MDFSGPILAVGRVKRGRIPQTGASPKCLIVEVRTPTTMGQFVELEIAESAACEMVARLRDFVDGRGSENWQSLEAEIEEQAERER